MKGLLWRPIAGPIFRQLWFPRHLFPLWLQVTYVLHIGTLKDSDTTRLFSGSARNRETWIPLPGCWILPPSIREAKDGTEPPLSSTYFQA